MTSTPNLSNGSTVKSGSGSTVAPRLSAKERAFNSFIKAADKDAHAEQKAEAARRKAIGESFASWIDNADEGLACQIFAGLEASATKTNRNRIASHPLRPNGVDALVEELLAERETVQISTPVEPLQRQNRIDAKTDPE